MIICLSQETFEYSLLVSYKKKVKPTSLGKMSEQSVTENWQKPTGGLSKTVLCRRLGRTLGRLSETYLKTLRMQIQPAMRGPNPRSDSVVKEQTERDD